MENQVEKNEIESDMRVLFLVKNGRKRKISIKTWVVQRKNYSK